MVSGGGKGTRECNAWEYYINILCMYEHDIMKYIIKYN